MNYIFENKKNSQAKFIPVKSNVFSFFLGNLAQTISSDRSRGIVLSIYFVFKSLYFNMELFLVFVFSCGELDSF